MVREQANQRFEMRITPSELEMLRKLSEAIGLPASLYLRMMIRKLHAEQFGKAKK